MVADRAALLLHRSNSIRRLMRVADCLRVSLHSLLRLLCLYFDRLLQFIAGMHLDRDALLREGV